MPEPEKKKCGPCEEALKKDLKEITCKQLSPEAQKKCQEEVEEYFKAPEVSPQDFVEHMKKKGYF